MIYIDLKDEKEKKKLSTALESLNINHNDILLSDSKYNNIVICDNDIDKVKQNHKTYKKVIVFNKNKSPLIDEVYYKRGVYSYSVMDELETILKVLNNNKNNNTIELKKLVTASFILIMLTMVLILSPKVLKGINKNISTAATKSEVVAKDKEENQEKNQIDYKKENIVFYGDSITEMYVLEDFYGDLPVVNAGHSGYMTPRLLDEVDEKLLVYNPTKVFMLMGTNDLAYSDLDNDQILSNIKEIVHKIQKDRKNVKIYIESIYPVKETRDLDPGVWHVRKNDRIREINEMIKELCEKENLTYIDVYDELKDEDGSIKEEYTIEGLHINQEGYKVITDKLMNYVKQA